MRPVLDFIVNGTMQSWSTIEGICTIVLIADALVLHLAQRGAHGQRRWAALGPLVAAVFAVVIAYGTRAAERSFFGAIRLCSFAYGDARCRGVVDSLDQQAQVDVEVLGWAIIGVTVALALLTTALLTSNRKPATASRPAPSMSWPSSVDCGNRA